MQHSPSRPSARQHHKPTAVSVPQHAFLRHSVSLHAAQSPIAPRRVTPNYVTSRHSIVHSRQTRRAPQPRESRADSPPRFLPSRRVKRPTPCARPDRNADGPPGSRAPHDPFGSNDPRKPESGGGRQWMPGAMF